jgi:hypothetical protein
MPKTQGDTNKVQRKRCEKTDEERAKAKKQKRKEQNTTKSLFVRGHQHLLEQDGHRSHFHQ